jgi:hypothetical protein
VAFPQPALQGRREALGASEALVPEIRDPCELGIERLTQPLDRLRQRVGEVLVLALPVAVALHDDVLAESRLLGPQRGERLAFRGVDQVPHDGEAASIEGVLVDHPDILPRPGHFFYPRPA